MKSVSSIIVISFVLLIISCKESSTSNDPWSNTNWIQLSNEKINIRLPNNFKRSSRYRIQKDIPILLKDTTQLRLLENSLEMLEFEDAELDVFVDSTQSYRLVVICNTQKLDFRRQDALSIKKQLEFDNAELQTTNPNLKYGAVEMKMNASPNIRLVRFTNSISNIQNNGKVYKSIYYLTAKSYSLVIYVISRSTDLVEKYLWSTKTR